MENKKDKKEIKLIKTDIILISIGILALIVIHILREDGNFIKNSLSNYAASEYGYIASIAFYLFAFVNITIGILFIDIKNKYIKIGSILFLLSGLFTVLLTIFHVDGNGIIETYREYIHVISACLLFITYPLLILFNGSQFRTRRLRVYSIASALIVTILTMIGIIFASQNLNTGLLETTLLGLLEKTGVLIIVIWIIIFLLSHNKLKRR